MHTRRLSSIATIASILASCHLNAQTAETGPVGTLDGESDRSFTGRSGVAPTPVDPPAYFGSAAPVVYRTIDSLANSFSYYTLGQQPISYESLSGVLATIKRGPIGQSNNIYIRTSTDMGTTWSAPIGPLHDATTLGGGRYPSVVPINLQNSANPADLYYYYCFPTVAGGAFGNFVWGVVDATGNPIGPPVNDPGVTPETWETSSKSILSATNDVLVTIGTLGNNNLGMRRLDVNTITATSSIPPQWAGSVFSVPTGDGRTSTVAGAARDANNTFYLGGYARFPAQETARRVHPWPGISTSTDKGMTWSEFDILPISKLVDYVNAEGEGANPDSVYFPYSAEDFAVTTSGGNGIAHYAVLCIESDSTKGDAPQMRHIVEVTRGPNGWNIRKISDYVGYFLYITSTDTASQTDNEVMLSTTADGSRLICKWTDAISYIFSDDIDGDQAAPDTMTTMDVFVSVRNASGGTWSPKVNVTETPMLDKIVWMPDEVPNDLSNIPMIGVQTIYDPAAGATLLDSIFTQQRLTEIAAYVVAFNGDASAAAGIDDRSRAVRAGMHLSGPTPNPARGRALATFTTPVDGSVIIALHDMQGRLVRTIVSEHKAAGNYGFIIDTDGLPTGSYTYSLTLDGMTLSRALTVTH